MNGEFSKGNGAIAEAQSQTEPFREIFDEAPGALWMEDWSDIKADIDRLTAEGVKDWRAYLAEHPETVAHYYDIAVPMEISDAAVYLYRAKDRKEIFEITRSEFSLKEQLDGFTEIVCCFIEGKTRVSLVAVDTRMDGTEIFIRNNVVMLRDHRHDWSRVLYSFEDVTEQKLAEDKIQELNRTLEQRVEERTAELRQAQRTLLRKERLAALGQLTATVAHELRNPLSTINTSLMLIEHASPEMDGALNGAIDRAERGVQRCERIVTDLLEFARPKELHTSFQPFGTWFEKAVDEFAIPDEVTLIRDFQSGDIEIEFDPEALRRAVMNLVDNACQAMLESETLEEDEDICQAKPKELTLRSRISHNRLEISVIDTGPGIAEEDLPNILEPLFSTRVYGTGLGLPVVRRIAEEHGGGLIFYSQLHEGTEMIIWLPIKGRTDSPEEPAVD
jgi:signal transduction histidine kinase